MSGQALTGPGGLESWHPRDIGTALEIYRNQASENRLAALRQQLKQGG